jgi:gliding motility-associated-like protein
MKNVNPVLHSFDNTGLMNVKVDVNYRACPSLSATKELRVFPVPDMYLGEDKAICPGGEPIRINDDRNAANPTARWKWSTGETGPTIVVSKPGTYTAEVNIDGCVTSDTVWVANDCYVTMPSVFTPNGDGVNDFFFPRSILSKGLVSFKMSIYNRWGQLIFETSAVEGSGWDGTLNNIAQPQGVYVYKIEAKFKDGQIEQHQGNITLLR